MMKESSSELSMVWFSAKSSLNICQVYSFKAIFYVANPLEEH